MDTFDDGATVIPWHHIFGDTGRKSFTVYNADNTAADVSSWSFTGYVVPSEGSATVEYTIAWELAGVADGVVAYNLTGDGTPAVGRHWYVLVLTNDDDGTKTWQKGPLIVEAGVTP